jgi:hypothetical protein
LGGSSRGAKKPRDEEGETPDQHRVSW